MPSEREKFRFDIKGTILKSDADFKQWKEDLEDVLYSANLIQFITYDFHEPMLLLSEPRVVSTLILNEIFPQLENELRRRLPMTVQSSASRSYNAGKTVQVVLPEEGIIPDEIRQSMYDAHISIIAGDYCYILFENEEEKAMKKERSQYSSKVRQCFSIIKNSVDPKYFPFLKKSRNPFLAFKNLTSHFVVDSQEEINLVLKDMTDIQYESLFQYCENFMQLEAKYSEAGGKETQRVLSLFRSKLPFKYRMKVAELQGNSIDVYLATFLQIARNERVLDSESVALAPSQPQIVGKIGKVNKKRIIDSEKSE